jgi:hypothetical protein
MTFRLTFGLLAVATILGLAALPQPPRSHVALGAGAERVPGVTPAPARPPAARLNVQPF